MDLRYFLLAAVLSVVIAFINADITTNEKEVSKFLKRVNKKLAILLDQETSAKWQNEISLVKDPNKTQVATDALTQFKFDISKNLTKFKNYQLKNTDLIKQLSLVPNLGYKVLPEKDYELMETVIKNLTDLNEKVTLCSYQNKKLCNLTYFPDIVHIFENSKDVKEMEYYWIEWQNKLQPVFTDDFKLFVDLYRKAAEMNGYSQASDFWYRDFRDSSKVIQKKLKEIMLQLKPLFQQAHAYVRGKLGAMYGSQLVEKTKPLPEHLFVQFFSKYIMDEAALDQPFKIYKTPNITDVLLKKNFTVKTNFIKAVNFFKSLGMQKLEKSFWRKNAKPMADVHDMNNNHKAWKFYGSHSVKFSYNHVVFDYTFSNMFEAVSHIYYYRAKENLTTLYQTEALPSLKVILGDFFTMAASSPKYLKKLGITYPSYRAKGARINRLYAQGLKDVFSISLFYLVERYRVDVIDKKIDIRDNCAYWQLAEEFYGVEPPVPRSSKAFDACPKLYLNIAQQYTDIIYSLVLKHQMFEHFCTLTGEYVKDDPKKPLDLCDLSGHPEVGQKINKALSLDSSADFKDVLKLLVSAEELNLNGLLEYYKPVYEWLKKENKKQNNPIGWERSNKCQP